ncbi:UNVERIFIED_CONTAM: hypothetical protein PYX00_011109 [Menopon gallinae]|uniref:Adenine phosphoribosyltransferase n=1 Tax=Menopon gallinae TaxID=328185 RepID=A0AAW2H5Z3_9NEOP
MNLENYINKIPDFPKKNILFYDMAPLLASADAWQFAVNKICDLVKQFNPDYLAGIESRGFLISAAIATKLKLGSILIRKKGKTPGEKISYSYKLEYGEDTLELNKCVIEPNKKVVILDDVLATGGTINASTHLLNKAELIPLSAICILELTTLHGRNNISIPTLSLLKV